MKEILQRKKSLNDKKRKCYTYNINRGNKVNITKRQRRKEFFDNYEKKYHKKITYENSLIETEARRFANKISSKYCHEIWKI